MKKRPMGGAVDGMFTTPKPATAQDALRLITSPTEKDPPAPRAPRRGPANKQPVENARAHVKGNVPLVVTSMRISHSHWKELHRAAIERVGDGTARPDVSAVLREILDGWMATRR